MPRGVAVLVLLLATTPAVSAPARYRDPSARTDRFETLSERGGVVKAGGRYTRTIRRVPGPDGVRWRIEVEWPDSSGRIHSHQMSEAEIGTLAPIRSRVRADRDSAAFAVRDHRVTGWSVPVSGPTRFVDEALPPGTLAAEFEDDAVAGLPLRTGYEATLTSLSLMGTVTRHTLRVVRADTVTVAGRARDCWRVEFAPRHPGDAKLTLWVDRATRRVWQRRGDFDAFAWIHRVTNP